jgi:bis(5'-nucleosidyl)-tetraphosphatase
MKKKPIKREYSAGGVVYRKKDKKILWLIIQPEGGGHWSKGRWQFPKGWIEAGEKPAETARREVEEEAGIKAEVIEKIDDLKIFFYDEEKNKVFKTITLFLMKYQRKGERKEDAEKIAAIKWLPYKEAHKRLTFKSEKEILAKAKKVLTGKGKQPELF